MVNIKIDVIYFIGLTTLPLILLWLPTDFFDTGKSICLSVSLIGKTCYGCGITRAIQHIIHLDFHAGYKLNKLSVIVCPLLFIVWFKEILRIYKIIQNAD